MEQATLTADPTPETGPFLEKSPESILESALMALNDGKIDEAVNEFDEHFTFIDNGLELTFTEKARLAEFLQKAHEMFPESVLEVLNIFQWSDYAVAQWKVTATEVVKYGSMPFRSPISLPGVSIVRIENGRITEWSDYYDQMKSRRVKLAAQFTEWVEL
jgi:steroid delta-isomerase-like uncharacterized protein